MYHHPISFRRQFPIEVQEKIIDQLRHDIWPLRSCALTCQAWHVRSRFHLFQDIHVRSLEQLNEICSYLRAHESLRPIVQSIVIESELPSISGPSWDKPVLPVSDLVCAPLLNQLPNLRRCQLRQIRRRLIHPVAFHPSMLTYLKIHSCIETLSLTGTISSTPTLLIEVLTSLPS
ncbi:hypothetical protein K466DRAFT_211215 [Polyporus arcularius HHB13444]|uniref:F-box domain-containing protein n=1 Tax=Polyporus arcularius HHB13444 TaxID=1314778 RepID=A0A5C3Q2C9_9APHY|nr:hypothetical protein K466DRAFT_211215 [Polyporus arcularius HHB13444]